MFANLLQFAQEQGIRIYSIDSLWEKTALLETVTLSDLVRVVAKTNQVQLQIEIPGNGVLFVKVKGKSNVEKARMGHTAWEIHSMVAKEGFIGYSLADNTIVSKEEYDTRLAAGEKLLINTTVNNGIIQIAKGAVELQAFPV